MMMQVVGKFIFCFVCFFGGAGIAAWFLGTSPKQITDWISRLTIEKMGNAAGDLAGAGFALVFIIALPSIIFGSLLLKGFKDFWRS